jgi:PhoPQ-activated pathogenicity-related protein
MRKMFHTVCLPTCFVGLVLSRPALGDLLEYVARPDPAFAWKAEEPQKLGPGTVTPIRLTSQVWQGITWEHDLRVVEPTQLKSDDTVLLFITGGSNTSRPWPEDSLQFLALAQMCGTRVAVLPQVPNQPLLDGKKEDDLIAETFVRFLETGDENWPLLFPMVKSAVRAMDAVQAWGEREGKGPVKQFVVTGASKRGWTTWLTAVADKRVVAIAPMVIDTLNFRAQIPNQLKVWGRYSEQIEDYTRRGLTEQIETPEGLRLWRLVDPHAYRDRLKMPKLIINGTNDRYWTLNALHLYWNDLPGAKNVVYLPNAGHSLKENREYALNGVAALVRHVLSQRPLPTVEWKYDDSAADAVRIHVTAKPMPKTSRVWVARSDTQDFRDSRWEPAPLPAASPLATELPRPATGNIAYVADLEYEIDALPYHLSTAIGQASASPTPPAASN